MKTDSGTRSPALIRLAPAHAVRSDCAATVKLDRALHRKIQAEEKLRKVGRVSPRPLAQMVKEAVSQPRT